MSEAPIIITQSSPEPRLIRRRNWPVATFVIMGLTILIFLLTELAGGSKNPDVLLTFGASYGPYIRRGEYWRLVMPMFLHIGFLHLLVNMYALYVLGRILEQVYGYGRYTLLYVACGMGGSFLSMMRSNNVAAGASGAIFGIAGIMLVAGYLHRDALHPRWGRIFGGGILPFIVVNLFLGFSIPHIDNWGHLGGLASGMLLAAIIPPPQHQIFPGAVTPQPSQALVVLPLVVVALAMTATAEHYRTYRSVTRLLQAAERLRAAGQHAKALEQIQQALRLDHTDERTHEELGTLYLTEDRLPEAIQAFEEAHRLSPDSPRAQLGLAAAYRRQGDFAKAQALLENVVGKNPHTAEGQQLLADLLAEQKLYPEAIQRYQEALRLNRNYTPAHNNLAWLFATCEDPQFRNPAKALEHARQAVELSGWKEPNYIDTLAEAFYVNGNFHEAVKVQTEALKLDPENPEFLEHMARYRKAAGV